MRPKAQYRRRIDVCKTGVTFENLPSSMLLNMNQATFEKLFMNMQKRLDQIVELAVKHKREDRNKGHE